MTFPKSKFEKQIPYLFTFFDKKSLISFSKHFHVKLSGDFADCVHFEASFGKHTVHQGSFYSFRTIFHMQYNVFNYFP